MQEKLLTTIEVSQILGVTTRRIRQLVQNGELQGKKVGRDLLIPVSAVEAAKQRKTKPGPARQTTTVEGIKSEKKVLRSGLKSKPRKLTKAARNDRKSKLNR